MSASETFQQGALVFITPADLVVSGYLYHTLENKPRCDHKSPLIVTKIEKQVKALRLSAYWVFLSSEEHF